MKPKQRWLITPLMMILILCMVASCSSPSLYLRGQDGHKIVRGETVEEDGYFLTPEGTKRMAQIVKERDALREELMDRPDRWTRLWTTLGAFGAGIGIGLLIL